MFQPWGKCVVDGIPTLRCIPVVFQNVVMAALMLAGTTAAFFIVYAGIRFVTSGGDQKKIEEAKKTLTWAIAGLVLILLSFLFLSIIGYVTGTKCILQFGFDSCK